MKRPIIYTCCFLCACLLGLTASCAKAPLGKEDRTGKEIAVSFRSSLEPSHVSTRTVDGGDRWSKNDGLGIFMLPSGDGMDEAFVSNAHYRVGELNANGTGAKLEPYPGATIYSEEGKVVDFIAYYPFVKDITQEWLLPIDLSDQERSDSLDILYSNSTTGEKLSSAPVYLNFAHALCKLAVSVKNASGFAFELEDLEAQWYGSPGKAVFDLQSGKLDDLEQTGPIWLKRLQGNTDGEEGVATEVHFQAILVPHLGGEYAGRQLSLADKSGNQWAWQIPDTQNYAAGKVYSYKISLKDAESLDATGSIQGWKNGGEEEKELQNRPDDMSPGNMHPGDKVQIKVPGFFTLEAAFIPHGQFRIGNSSFSYAQEREVLLTKDYLLCLYETTNAEFSAFLNDEGIGPDGSDKDSTPLLSVPNDGHPWGMIYENNQWRPMEGCAKRPAIFVYWQGAARYAEWLSLKTKQKFRLPTEAEWERACRAESTTPYFVEEEALADYVWYSVNSDDQTHEVGLRKPNRWNLYDMLGNVWELCSDWSQSWGDTPSEVLIDPQGPASGSFKVVRGGSYSDNVNNLSSGNRGMGSSVLKGAYGFRLLCEL